MDWKRLIKELNDAGHTQVAIAERCEVSQSTVSDLARGASKSPSYQFGAALAAMHAELAPTPAPAKQAA